MPCFTPPGAMATDMLASTGDKFRLPGCVRDTVITHSRLAWRHERAQAAVASRHGLQALPIEGLAARLAGGFLQPIDPDALKAAITKALSADLGDLNRIKELARVSARRGGNPVQGMDSRIEPRRPRRDRGARGGVPPDSGRTAGSGGHSAFATLDVPAGRSRRRRASAHIPCPHAFRPNRCPWPHRNVTGLAAASRSARGRDRGAMDRRPPHRAALGSRARHSGRGGATGKPGNSRRIVRQPAARGARSAAMGARARRRRKRAAGGNRHRRRLSGGVGRSFRSRSAR